MKRAINHLLALAPALLGSIYFFGILIAQVGCTCAGKSALALKRVGVVCQRKEIQIFHIGRVLERLLHCTGSVRKVCMRM